MQFKEFLAESFDKEYAFRLKFAADCGADEMAALEACLQKYNVVSIAPWKRTPIQENPVEFVRAKGINCLSEVSSTDIVLKYPTNPRLLEVWLAVNMNLHPNHVIAYNVKEPRLAFADEASQRVEGDVGREVTEDDALLADDEYNDDAVDHDLYYGAGHQEKFLAELERIKKEKGDDYFRHYPSKDELMGDTLRATWDTIHNGVNMGKGPEDSKEVHTNDQRLGH